MKQIVAAKKGLAARDQNEACSASEGSENSPTSPILQKENSIVHKNAPILDFHSQVAYSRLFLSRQHRYVVDPDSKVYIAWECVLLFASTFVALVTPYEISLIEGHKMGWLFYCNMIINGIFLQDMIINFFLAFWEDDGLTAGGTLVYDLRRIRRHYLKTWFLPDSLSIIPFELAGLFFRKTLYKLNIIKLLRLLKLIRVVKASHSVSNVFMKVGLTFTTYSIIYFSVFGLLINHWFSCLWCLIGRFYFETGQLNWISICLGEKNNNFDPFATYSQAAYFTAYTILTIGYGNILATNAGERWCCVFMMFVGSFSWAYAIGNASAIVATIDTENIEYHQMMDLVNNFLEDHNMDHQTRLKMRAYFRKFRQLKWTKHEKLIVQKLCPALRDLVSLKISFWVTSVRWHNQASKGFLTIMTQSMTCALFSPGEVLPSINHLCVVVRGVASKTKVLLRGGVYGEDLLLHSIFLKDKTPALSITHTELMFINQPHFLEILSHFPKDAKYLRRFVLKIALRRAFKLLLFFAKCGWRLPEKAKIPFASHSPLRKEVGEKYEKFIHQLHPQLSTKRLESEQVPEDILELIDLTEKTEHEDGDGWQRDMRGHQVKGQVARIQCKLPTHEMLGTQVINLQSTLSDFFFSMHKMENYLEEIAIVLKCNAEGSISQTKTRLDSFSLSEVDVENVVLSVEIPSTETIISRKTRKNTTKAWKDEFDSHVKYAPTGITKIQRNKS